MSSSDDHGELKVSSAGNGESGGSRKSSLATQSTVQTKTSTTDAFESRSATEHNEPDTETVHSGSIDFSVAIETGADYLNNPARARKWLLSFGLKKEGTDVSLLLRTVRADVRSQGPFSILPLLTQWTQSWYSAARKRRKAENSARSVNSPEQEDLDWLLQFIADYLDIGHDFFDEQEQFQLCSSLTSICQDTSRSEDIVASIKILHALAVNRTFPKDALREALDMFCEVTTILSDTASALEDCMKLLLTGPIHDQAIQHLLEFAVVPTVQNNSKKLMRARGALRQLSAALSFLDDAGRQVVDIEDFVSSLQEASKCCIYRYCTEIMKACHTILASQRSEQVLPRTFDTIMGVVDNCLRTVLPRTASSRSLNSLQHPDREQALENDRQNTKYLAERNLVLKLVLLDFEQHWHFLSNEQQHRTCDFFLDHSKDLSNSQAQMIASYLGEHGLSGLNGAESTQKLNKVFDTFIRNSKLDFDVRSHVLSTCAQAAKEALSPSNASCGDSVGHTSAVGHGLVDRLLNLLTTIPDWKFIPAMLVELKNLAFCADEDNRFPYADLILRKLLWFVKNERGGDDDTQDGHAVAFAMTIQDIFVRSISEAPITALKTYDALLEITSTNTRSRKARLIALRLLLCIRCDDSGMVYLEDASDSQYIAIALCRTAESREAFAHDSTYSQRHKAGPVNSVQFANPKQLWSYPDEAELRNFTTKDALSLVGVKGATGDSFPAAGEIKMSSWLVKVIECLQNDNDWETYSYILVHLGSQLFNTKLFSTSLEALVKLRQVMCTQIVNNTFKEPPASTGLKKSDAALCMFNMLTALIPYATMKSETIQKGFGDDLVRAFLSGIGGTWDGTSRGCIHALCICSFEVPSSVASLYPSIVSKMSKNMTQTHLTIHILEFMAQVARLPEVHSNFTQDEITMIFGICLQFLEKAREHQGSASNPSPRAGTLSRHSGLNLRRPPYRAAILQDEGLPQYASALAYHTMIFWFLSIKLEVRAKYVSWIVPRLVWKTSDGEETIDEQGQVFIDMMQRTAFSDLGETRPNPNFATEDDGAVSSSSWIVGLSVITVETAGHTGMTQITKRQASGTTHTMYQQSTRPVQSHHVPSHTEISPEDSRYGATSILPSHVLLQMVTSAAPTSIADQPIPLTQDESTIRALNVFDRIPTVDGHKLGVLYIGPGQTKDSEYLANITGSQDYHDFLNGLGYTVSLIPMLDYNPQGLQYPRDGENTIAFRDRVTEIVFHVPTMMPNNLVEDPFCNTKKSHVGNCHVVVIFNESGLPWDMGNFPSQVTFVHIVITPATRPAGAQNSHGSHARAAPCEYYQVHVLTKEDHPNVTPVVDPKVISRDMLPDFVRMFGLNADVSSQAKVADDSDDKEFPSSWRARLQQIKRLKQRAIEKLESSTPAHSIASFTTPVTTSGGGRRTPVARDDASRGERDEDDDKDGALAVQLDFGKWTL